MFLYLFILVIIICIIALIVTFSIGKEIDQTQKKYKEEGQKANQEVERAHVYEHSFSNVKRILLIYALTFFVALIVVLGILVF